MRSRSRWLLCVLLGCGRPATRSPQAPPIATPTPVLTPAAPAPTPPAPPPIEQVTSAAPPVTASAPAPHLRTVFIIVMENTSWGHLDGDPRAPYINQLLRTGARADDYRSPPHVRPSEPNYIWLEAGSRLGIHTNSSPRANHRSTPQHLTMLLGAAGIPWKTYQQGISGTTCPLTAEGRYAPKHNPFVFFDDLTGARNPADPGCIAHMRPLGELARDLASVDTTPRYVFITPDLCHDMHDRCPPTRDRIRQGDDFLRETVELIRRSPAYPSAAVFITWDESEGRDVPIGLIVASPFAKVGYANRVPYTHSSTLKTVQEILGVTPLLGEAALPSTQDLADLFSSGF